MLVRVMAVFCLTRSHGLRWEGVRQKTGHLATLLPSHPHTLAILILTAVVVGGDAQQGRAGHGRAHSRDGGRARARQGSAGAASFTGRPEAFELPICLLVRVVSNGGPITMSR